mmetsp:Transcript_1644/g.4895  ORF Transcript_1644/g.4895 Transcript_1644/m.4895 type:complete len:340 (-) Transcript_1644:1048-2067(-)
MRPAASRYACAAVITDATHSGHLGLAPGASNRPAGRWNALVEALPARVVPDADGAVLRPGEQPPARVVKADRREARRARAGEEAGLWLRVETRLLDARRQRPSEDGEALVRSDSKIEPRVANETDQPLGRQPRHRRCVALLGGGLCGGKREVPGKAMLGDAAALAKTLCHNDSLLLRVVQHASGPAAAFRRRERLHASVCPQVPHAHRAILGAGQELVVYLVEGEMRHRRGVRSQRSDWLGHTRQPEMHGALAAAARREEALRGNPDETGHRPARWVAQSVARSQFLVAEVPQHHRAVRRAGQQPVERLLPLELIHPPVVRCCVHHHRQLAAQKRRPIE